MKRIDSIIKKKNGEVDIIFNDGKILHTEIDTFTDYYLYENKEITDEEFFSIEKKTNQSSTKQYLIKLLNKKMFSEMQIRKKLQEKEIEEIDQYIEFLKDIKLLNDEQYFQDLVFSLEEKGYGYFKINERLQEVGLQKEYIFDKEKEIKKAIKVLPSLIKKYSHYNFFKMKESITNSLLYLGFSSEIIDIVIKEVNERDFEKFENEKLQKDYIKLTYKLAKNEIKDKREFIITKLKMKGYKYSDIIYLLEEESI